MAERHFVAGAGGAPYLWSQTANWSLTEGGAGGQAVPLATDDVFFDAGSPNCTLNTTIRVAKTLTTSAYTNTLTFDVSLRVSGNITIGSGTQFAGATTNYLGMIANGTWTTNGLTIPQDIYMGLNTLADGTFTLADALTTTGVIYFPCTTSTTFSGDFQLTGGGADISGTQTITLIRNIIITGSTNITAGAHVVNGAFNWQTAGLTSDANGTVTGTTTFVLTGGTWSGNTTASVSNNVTIAGDITLSGTISYLAGTITYSSGTVTQGTSVLSIGSSCTLDTAGMNWYSIKITAAITVTLNSLCSGTGTLTLPNAAVTFDGTHGFTMGTFANTTLTANRILTLTAAKTYTITDAMNLKGITTGKWSIVSSTPGTKVVFTLGYGATQTNVYVNPTDLDSSLGQSIYSAYGVIDTCYNWSTSLGHGRIIPDAGGESVTVAGITKTLGGMALGSCDVYLFRDNGNDTATYIAYQESNSSTGAYSFTVFPGSAYFVAAFKGGATPVMAVTDRTLAAA